MSLQIWLPLNGDLTNKGLYKITPTLINNALGSTTNSKIGGSTSYSWTTDGAGVVLSNFMPVLKTYTSYTFSAWVYFTGPATNHSTTICSSGDWNQANGQLCFGLYNYNSGYAHVLTPNLNSWSDGVALPTKLVPNTWYHITATYDGAVTTVYINGEKVGTYNGGGITSHSNTESLYIGRATYYEGFTIKGTINDFRIYDNCLNPKEVKLLSQGLVWHCKLNSISNPNLVSGITSGGQTTVLSKYSVSVNFGNNADSYFYLTFPSGTLALNKIYTLSFDVKDFPDEGSQGWYMFKQGSSNHVFTINRNGHYEWTFSTESGKMPSGYSFTSAILDDGGRSGPYGTYTIYNIKVEEGPSATRWCPHSTDTAQYAIFEKTKDIEDDCSGYGWNGIRYGVTGSGDSARYLHCGQFAYGNYIRTDAFRTVGWTDFTMAAWVNPSTYAATGGSTDRQTIIIGGMYLTLENGVVSTYCYGKTTAYYNGTTKIPLNTWSHIAVSYDKAGNLKIYVNGVLDKTYTGLTGACEDIQFHKQKEIGAETNGGSRQYQGKISDVRIYSTALTETAIKELYNLGASYTNDGALLTYEINANANTDRIKQSKKSIIAGEFSEIGYIENMKTKILDDGSVWARIHWLDVSKSESWFSGNEVQDCDKANRFSKMHLVDKFTNGVYEFMLTYPETTGYNRWTQTSSPNAATVTGLNKIKTTWNDHYGGIRRSSGACYYDCDTGGTWYGAIGQTSAWTTGKYIPGADGNSYKQTELWVRIDQLSNLTKFSMLNKKYIQAFEIHEI